MVKMNFSHCSQPLVRLRLGKIQNKFNLVESLPHSIKKNKFFLNIHSLRFWFFSRLSSAFFLFAR